MDAPQIIQAVAETLFTKATNNGSFDLKKFKEVSFLVFTSVVNNFVADA